MIKTLLTIVKTGWCQISFAIIYFVVLVIGMSYRVLPQYGGITYNDAGYLWNIGNSGLINYLSVWNNNFLGQDVSNILFTYIPKAVLTFCFHSVGISDNVVSYLLSFGLVFLCGVLYFFVFKSISKNYWFAILAGTFAILNNLSIEHIGFGGGYSYLFTGLIAFALLFYILTKIQSRKEIQFKDVILLLLSSLFIVHPFYVVIFFMIIVLYLIYFFYFARVSILVLIKRFAQIIVGFTLLHAYWLIGFFSGLISKGASSTYSGNLEGVYGGFIQVASYINSVNFFHYFNFFARKLGYTPIHYLFYLAIVGAMFGLFFFSSKILRPKEKSLLGFIIVLYLLFSNLAMGPVSKLTGLPWKFMWSHFTFFAFFRSFPRFLIIIIPIYLVFFALFVAGWKSKTKNILIIFVTLLVIVLNSVVFTGDLKGTILATKIPNEYFEIEQKFFEPDKSDSKIIAFPNMPDEIYSWGLNREQAIVTQDYFLKESLFSKPVVYNRSSIELADMNPLFEQIFRYENFNFDLLDQNLEKLNIGYVLLQKDFADFNWGKKVENFETFQNYFLTNQSYELLESNKYFDLYRFKKSTSLINGNRVKYQKVSANEYKVFVFNLKDPEDISFLENYHDGWKLYLNKPENLSCGNADSMQSQCKNIKSAVSWNSFLNIAKRPIFESSHQKAFDYANKWTVDPKLIQSQYSNDYFQTNQDGSINIEMNLFFLPQANLIAGMLVSILTLLALIFSTIWIFKHGKK